MSSIDQSVQDAWYKYSGIDNDVILSSRTRLARNLANFPFPSKLRGNDGERVQSIIFDAFNQIRDCNDYQAVVVKNLDGLGSRILEERGILSEFDSVSGKAQDEGIVIRKDGRVSCTVNVIDHLRISSFAPGLDFEKSLEAGREIDEQLQKIVQFAASYEYGFLTASLLDAGSGMKLSMRVHLPSLSMLGRITSVMQDFKNSGLVFKASYGAGGMYVTGSGCGAGTSLGSYYDICTSDCQTGSEFDQVASIVSAGKKLSEMERSAREECKKTMPSDIRNYLLRSLAIAKNSIFISLREAIDIISGVKWGLDMGLINGIDDSVLYALLFRIQEGHLEYVLKNNNFSFENDIVGVRNKENERLRSIIFQEAFESIDSAL